MANIPKFTRGNLAKKLQLNPETLRYYEAQKLIKKPFRLANNYRIYDQEDVRRIQFVLMAKKLGFSLQEIKGLLNLSITEKTDRNKVREIAEKKSNIMKVKIQQLTSMKNILDELILQCKGDYTAAECPILKSMTIVTK